MNNGAMQLIGLVFGIILGRLLSPSDYGLLSMIAVFPLVAIALQNSGFATAIGNMEHPKDSDYNSVFWFNIIVGFSLYLILFFCAPLIAHYYHDDRLIALSRVAFLNIIFSCLGTAQSAYLFKNMMVKQSAKASITAVLISNIIGAVMAWQGFAYWSLSVQSVAYVALNTSLMWHYSHWHPTWHIDFGPVRRMFSFSFKIAATTIATHINNNVLNILLGHYFSAHDTGNYNQAYQWNFKCFSLLQGMLLPITQPTLVNLQNDRERQLNAFRKMVRFASFISFPLLFGLSLVSYEFIVILLTDKWAASAQLLQLLCLCGSVMPLCTLLSNMIISKGKSDIYLYCTIALMLLQIGAMVLCWRHGIHTLVCIYVGLNIAWMFVWFYFARQLSGYRLRHFLQDTLPFALAAAGVMLFTHYVTAVINNLYLLLGARILMAAALYYAVMKIAKVQILEECIGFFKNKLKR
jgi:O-antigen/teichoic acid export membrane protein